jgi:hypothetical protein
LRHYATSRKVAGSISDEVIGFFSVYLMLPVKDEKRDVLADSHNILNRWKNYFSRLLNVHRVSDVRQIEIHTSPSY